MIEKVRSGFMSWLLLLIHATGRVDSRGQRRTNPIVRGTFWCYCDYHSFSRSAFELYKSKSKGNEEIAARFKETFSMPNVRVHFVGVW